MSNELGLHRQDGNSRDPLSTIDGHCSARTMVLRWIEQQDKTSITRDLYNVVDLYDEDILNSFDRSDRSDSTTSSLQHSELSVTALPIIPSDKFFFENPSRTERWFDRCGSLKTSGSVKQIWVIVLVIICILSPIIIGSSILVFVIRLTSIFPTPTSVGSQTNVTSFPSIYRLPNPCTYSRIYPLISLNDRPSFNYKYFSKVYKAMGNRAMLTFALHHDPFYWCVDDISVKELYSNKELLRNGDFESISPTGFIRCYPSSNSPTTQFSTSLHPHRGNQSFCDGTVGTASYLSQMIEMEFGRMYQLSFWLRNLGDVPNNAFVFISYD